MTVPAERTAPQQLARLIWNPGKTRIMHELKSSGIAPYQFAFIEAIKTIGHDVLGVGNCIADATDAKFRGSNITVEDVMKSFPLLGEASSRGIMTPEGIIEGLERVRYVGDSSGFVSASCLLPEYMRLGTVTDEPVAVPYGNRIPVARMDLHPIALPDEQGKRHVAENSSVWQRMAGYIHLGSPHTRMYSMEEFMDAAGKSQVTLIPFSLKEKAFDFWIKDPAIQDGRGKELCGKIVLQAAAVMQAPSGPPDHFPARTVIGFDLDRVWSKQSLEVIDGMRHALAESMAKGYLRDQDLLRNPVNAGGMTGK